MSRLPGRPDLDQLRRQARELQRAAADGDEDSVRRIRAVSAGLTLSAAQLVIAREYGFMSWAKLRDEVAKRRAAPDEVADGAAGWLPRGYQENTAAARPPAPRAARRPAPSLGPLTVVIEGFDLPGLTCQPGPGLTVHRDIHVALYSRGKDRPALAMPGSPWLAAEPVPGDSPAARWEVTVTVRQGDSGYDFSGPFVRGDRTDRHLGLAWGDVPGDGTLKLFRGAKLRLADVPPGLIAQAMRPGCHLLARVRLTDASGNPVCARLRAPYIAWSAEPGAPVP